jgi:hypoxanthine phosphoribosyltransferase
MSLHSYDHVHTSELRITWEQLGSLCGALALQVALFDPEVVVGVAKGGVIPGATIASILRREFYPIRLSRRYNDEVVREHPAVLVGPPPDAVKGRRALIIDEIAVSGETLQLAVELLREAGAAEIRTATLYVHGGSWRPDYFVIESDALIINPWDYQVLKNGELVIHPEYQAERDRMTQTNGEPTWNTS